MKRGIGVLYYIKSQMNYCNKYLSLIHIISYLILITYQLYIILFCVYLFVCAFITFFNTLTILILF